VALSVDSLVCRDDEMSGDFIRRRSFISSLVFGCAMKGAASYGFLLHLNMLCKMVFSEPYIVLPIKIYL
jgi:hypothetical protein